MENFPYIFLELIISTTERHLYIGKNLQTIMDDTEGGTKFSGETILGINPLSLDQAKICGCHYFAMLLKLCKKATPVIMLVKLKHHSQ